MKKTIQIFKSAFVAAFIALALVSCSSDDSPSGTKLQYRINFTGNTVLSITFADKDNNQVLVPTEDLTSSWAKTIRVKAPFEATEIASFVNNTTADQLYSLEIYADDELVASKNGTIPAGETTNEFLQYDVTQ